MTTTLTNSQLLDQFNLHAQLEPEAMEAVIDFTGHSLQRQGDVMLVKQTDVEKVATTLVEANGIAVVSSEAKQGNTHILHAYEGKVYFDANTHLLQNERVVYGLLTVEEGSTAVLIHTGEHPALGVTAGNYLVLGQVEGATEIRRVAD